MDYFEAVQVACSVGVIFPSPSLSAAEGSLVMLDHSSWVNAPSPFLSYFLITLWENASILLSTLISATSDGGAEAVVDDEAGELFDDVDGDVEATAVFDELESLDEAPRTTPLSVATRHSLEVINPSLLRSN